MRMIMIGGIYYFYQRICKFLVGRKFILMLRKHHDQELNDLRRFYSQAKVQEDHNLDKDRELLRELIGKLTNLKLEVAGKGNYHGYRYRVSVDIDPKLVDRCFIHGGDQYAIDFLCRELGYQVGIEMQTLNFRRLALEASRDHELNKRGWARA